MKLAKTTPGPWNVSGCQVMAGKVYVGESYCEGMREDRPHWASDHYGHKDYVVPDGPEAADGTYPDGQGEGWREAWANAHLMAAAPDLLEAAKFALESLENMFTSDFANGGDRPVRDALEAAIKKATEYRPATR